jgi:prolipoprotein diacylglyceryltransferase
MAFPYYIHIGALQIHPHIFFEAIAYTVTFQLLLFLSRKGDNIPFSQRTSVMVGGLIGAVLGAKILVVLNHPDLWGSANDTLMLFLQGKTIVGALLGGLIGVEVTKKLVGITISTGDTFTYPMIAGIAIGRIGCFLTGLSDKTYGIATSLLWGVDFGDGILRHPTQIYEIIFLITLLAFIYLRSRYERESGDLFRFFMIGYLSFRLAVDFIKPDYHILLGMSAIQIVCVLALFYYTKDMNRIFVFRKADTKTDLI